LALLAASPAAGVLSDRIGGKYILVAGLIVLAFSDLLVARFRVDTRPGELILPFVVMGLGMGMSMTPLTNLTLYGVPAEKAGGASGLLATMRQIGAVMGVAVFGVALQANMVSSIKVHAGEVPHLPPAARTVLVNYVAGGGLYGVPDSGKNGLAAQLAAAMQGQPMKEMGAGIDLAMKRSFTDSINDTFRIAALIGIGAVAVALFIAGNQSARKLRPVDVSTAEDDVETAELIEEEKLA
jgi:MFS family permease